MPADLYFERTLVNRILQLDITPTISPPATISLLLSHNYSADVRTLSRNSTSLAMQIQLHVIRII